MYHTFLGSTERGTRRRAIEAAGGEEEDLNINLEANILSQCGRYPVVYISQSMIWWVFSHDDWY